MRLLQHASAQFDPPVAHNLKSVHQLSRSQQCSSILAYVVRGINSNSMFLDQEFNDAKISSVHSPHQHCLSCLIASLLSHTLKFNVVPDTATASRTQSPCPHLYT